MDLKFLKRASSFLFTQECADRYFDDFDFMHVDCFKATLSKGLGIAIILGSLLVKVPQILKIVKSKSVKGINFLSVMADTFATTATSAYSFAHGFPFSAWGDGVFLALQTVIIATLVIFDFKHTFKATAFVAAYLSVVAAVLTGIATKDFLWTCQAINTPVVVIGKLIQAFTNYTNGSTGQLSAVTLFLLFFGSVARIFTSIQETGDITMIVLYCWSTFGNAVLLLQLLYYWNADTKKAKSAKKHK